jgi:hypothetical protein
MAAMMHRHRPEAVEIIRFPSQVRTYSILMSKLQPVNGQATSLPGVASLWPQLAQLTLVVEACELERLEVHPSFSVNRTTTQIRLLGAGTDGLGEDICPFPDEPAARPSPPLTGEWTLERFCDHLAAVEQWPTPPRWEAARMYRNWAYESAALDLALRQAGCALHDVLELEPRPVRFVNSLGLGDPPSTGTIRDRLARYPSLLQTRRYPRLDTGADDGARRHRCR